MCVGMALVPPSTTIYSNYISERTGAARYISRCQRDHQNCTFLFDWAWWSALSLNCAAWINLSWKTSGKLERWYLISADATLWEHQKKVEDEWSEVSRSVWGWLARLSPRFVAAVNSILNQGKASPPPYMRLDLEKTSIFSRRSFIDVTKFN